MNAEPLTTDKAFELGAEKERQAILAFLRGSRHKQPKDSLALMKVALSIEAGLHHRCDCCGCYR